MATTAVRHHAMPLASDQNTAPERFPPAARHMLALREQVLALWLERVRARIVQASKLRHPVLVDTLPAFYDNIVESVAADYPRSVAVDGSTLASEHGGERARLTGYDHTALIEEYQVLRGAIFDVLHGANVELGYRDMLAINASIDIAIQEAIEAFSLVHSGLRERFAAALTHDLRGPLGNCANALELILMSDDPARMRDLAGRALSSARRVGGMVDELLDTMAFHGGKRLQLTPAPTDILDVLRELDAEAAGLNGATLRWEHRSVQGWWDRAALKRAVENLVTNAVKYGRPGTPVTIRVDEANERLAVSVHNEGEPIPPVEQECIFQMYRRANAAAGSAKQGWGIGLPYVRAVAESHGGSIGLDSSLERGTTFAIDIPLDCRPFLDAPSLENGRD
jgi:signal transduction histidine kinase